MKSSSIKANFTKHLKAHSKGDIFYGNWYCGITNNIVRRQNEHIRRIGKVYDFYFLKANSKNMANEVELYFSEKGTKNFSHSGGAKTNSNKVYIFRIPKTKTSKGLNVPATTPSSVLDIFFK